MKYKIFIKNRVFINALWLLSEKIISFLGLLLVTSSVAKYVGPETFGKINISIYYFSILQAIAIWGTDTIGIKLISRYPVRGVSFLYTMNFLKVTLYSILSVVILFYFYFNYDHITFIYTLAVFVSTFASIADYAYLYNEATLRSKLNVIYNIIGLFISLLIRYLIVIWKIDPIYLCISIVSQGVIPFILRYIDFKISIKQGGVKFSKKLLFFGLKTGFGLLLSSVSVMIYLNVGRVFLSKYTNLTTVGIYSVAFVLGSTWSFVNNAIIVSLTPRLYSSKNNGLESVSSFIFQFTILISLFYFGSFLFFGKEFIQLLYGDNYTDAYNIAKILILSTSLSSLGMISARYIIAKGGYYYEAKKAILTAAISIIISFFFIKYYGIYGAAWSTVFCELMSLTLFNYFYNRGVLLQVHCKAFNVKLFHNELNNIFKSTKN